MHDESLDLVVLLNAQEMDIFTEIAVAFDFEDGSDIGVQTSTFFL